MELNLCECGGEAVFAKIGKHCGFVRCTKCDTTSKIYTSKQNAIKAWNKDWGTHHFLLCPLCGGKTKIIDSRPEEDAVNRRRKCLECGYRFLTVEIDKDLYERVFKEK